MKQLKGGRPRPKYRLSPNEVEQLKKEETERRRKLRIVQVREQSKTVAANIRQNVKQERKRQLVKLATEIENELDEEKEEEVRRLERQYDNTLRTIGQGHTQAILTDKEMCLADKHITAYQNKERAQERHKEALRKEALDKAYKEYEDTKQLRDRQAALMEEKMRAAEVASRPPPPPDPISDVLLKRSKLKRPIPLTDMNAFSSTHYHIPDCAVEKAPPEQQHDGRMAGEEEDQRTKEEVDERRKKEHDQIIMARIRGNEALKKEKLKHEYDALMADLSLQQRADRRQRQLVVSKLPRQVFIPPDRRMEELDDKQMEMERAFEDMYMKQINLSGDLSLTLDPNPLALTPADNSLEAIEDSPVVIPIMPAFNPALRELTNVSGTQQGQTTQQGKPETVLKNLLKRIKDQRSELQQEETTLADIGNENLVRRPQKKGGKDAEPDHPGAAMPTSKPSADPQLDLSPHKLSGNLRPQKSPDREEREEEWGEEEEEEEGGMDGGEACFLQHLQHRLQAIEEQKNHLDRKMRERQQQQPQQQPQQQKQAPYFPYPSAAHSQPSLVPPSLNRLSGPSAGPPSRFQAPASLYSGQPMGGPAGDVGTAATSHVRKVGDRNFSAIPDGASAEYRPSVPTYTSLDPQNTGPASLQRGGGVGEREGAGGEGRSMLGTGRWVSLGSADAALSGQSGPGHCPPSQRFSQSGPDPAPVCGEVGTHPAVASVLAQGFGGQLGSFAAGAMPGQLQSLQSAGSLLSAGRLTAPSAGQATAPGFALSTGRLTASSGTAAGGQGPVGGTRFQAASSFPLSSAMSQVYGTKLASFPASQSVRNSGDVHPASTTSANIPSLSESSKPLKDASSVAGGLESGNEEEEERLRKLREYQQQLIVKHQERMKALQGVRTSIETRQAQANGQSIASASQRWPDPASMVPYTLKTSLFQPESSSVHSSSASSRLPARTAMPLASAAGFSNVLSSDGGGQQVHEGGRLDDSARAGPGYLPGRVAEFLSAKTKAPMSSQEMAGVVAATELILAGSAGVSVSRESASAPQAVGTRGTRREDRPLTASSGSNAAAASKLDSVRKSLPFDDLDETRGEGVAEGSGVLEEVSIADDSHLSSSTERGSPALGSRSNKSSMSGKSGSGLSTLSDGSLGGSSLVARAEEKRLSFEQRQRELQGQLAEIQRQKDALLERYHGNQQRVSAQEESLRSKLKTAKAGVSASSAPVSLPLDQQPGSAAVSLGVHQSASPSLDLEERSLSSGRLSAGRSSWAMELEEYSLSNPGPDGVFKSPASMTLEEVSIASERSSGREVTTAAQTTERSIPERSLTERSITERSLTERSIAERSIPERSLTERSILERLVSSVSSLEEYSIASGGKTSMQGEEGWLQPSLSVQGSQERPSARRAGPDSLDRPDSGRGRLDIGDLLQELGEAGARAGEDSGTRGASSSSSLSGVAAAEQFAKEEDDPESSRLPPPAARQPATTMGDYEPHELSTILEVDTPQTGNKTTRPSPTGPLEGTDKPASRRYIDFGKHGMDDDRYSKFSASGSSASSDVRSVIEVRPGMLKSGETTSATGSGNDTSFSLRGDEKRFRDNILESSSVKGTTAQQGAGRPDPRHVPSQEVSYASSGQGFQSLELTLDSLTPRSVSVEDSQARRYLDFNSREPAGEEGGRGGLQTDQVLKQARMFNQDLMAAIHRQSAEVFDQSSLSGLSADQSRNSQLSGQNQTPQL